MDRSDPASSNSPIRGRATAETPPGASSIRPTTGPRIVDAWPPPSLVESIERELGPHRSRVALVLGSGLGGIATSMHMHWSGDAARMPGYPMSSVAGHEGRLIFGRLPRMRSGESPSHGPWIWVVQGRVHLYEGHAPETVTRYLRLLHALGVTTLVLTNAAGSVDTRVQPGDLVLADDAISMFHRPLAPARTGPHASLWQSRASALSDPRLIELAEETASALGIALQRGVLVGSLGPSYETAAEVRAWRRFGGTVASMSTVPEAVHARELGMNVLLFSLVTNLGTGLSPQRLSHADVVATADRAGVRLGTLLTELTFRLGESDR